MAEINFLEPEGKEPEKTNYSRLLLIVIIMVAVVVVAFLTLRETIELSTLENQKSSMSQFIESADTKHKLKEYSEIQASITEIQNQNMPIAKAYADYKIMNTVTGSLVDDYVWAPIKASPDRMEFKSLSIAGNKLTINICVNDTGVMREYQTALSEMLVNVDKDNIDKIPGDEKAEDDKEINKFKEQFTTQITRQTDPNFKPPYEGTLGIFINKDITEDMYKLLGEGR